jgi:hypothetical protein
MVVAVMQRQAEANLMAGVMFEVVMTDYFRQY